MPASRLALAALLATVLAPLVVASDNGYDGAMVPTETGYAVTQTDEFSLPGIHAGDVVSATLTWDNPNADLDLRLTPPGGSCEIAPSPDVNCLAGNRVPSGVPTCAYAGNAPFVGGATSESFTKTAAVAGTFTVDVEAAWVSPADVAYYHLEVSVNGVPVDLSTATPTSTNIVHSTDLVCHAQLP